MATKRIGSIDSLPDSARVSDREIAELVGVVPTTIWRWARAGILPAPLKISPRCTRWNLGDVRKALADQKAA
jgi:prophage regulatory protein